MICFEKHSIQHYGSALVCFPSGPSGHLCSLIWLPFRHLRPSCLGIMPVPNPENFATLTPPFDINTNMLYTVPDLSRRPSLFLPYNNSLVMIWLPRGASTTCLQEHQSQMNYCPNGWKIRKSSTNWKVKSNQPLHQTKIKPSHWWFGLQLLKYPWFPCYPKAQEWSSQITANDYLTATFKCSWSVNEQLNTSTQQVKQYKDLITEFEETKHVYYWNVYQQGYYYVRNLKKNNNTTGQ